MGEPLVVILLAALLVFAVASFFLLLAAQRRESGRGQLLAGTESKLMLVERGLERAERSLRDDVTGQAKLLRDEVGTTISHLRDTLEKRASDSLQMQEQRSRALFEQFMGRLDALMQRLDKLTEENRLHGEKLRESVENRLKAIQEDNAQKLELMRATVDEKLQGTLEKRLGESFKLVSERLELVHKDLGEMRTLAVGVGDLKKVLSNVKVRGTWSEVQLGNLLEQVLTADQFAKNVTLRPGASERVEYAVKLPGKEDGEPEVWLPIDAKFPQEDYQRLVDASERGAVEEMDVALKALDTAIKAAARDISEKYVAPPHTTDFAILFLPTEGLYAEVLRRPGLADVLQRERRVVIAGPTTLLALLNSLQMGFRTLAIQKRSSEVWKVLGAVKTEFAKYGGAMEKLRKKLNEATKVVEQVGTRQRAMDRKLRDVQALPAADAGVLLGTAAAVEASEEDEPVEDVRPADHAGTPVPEPA